VKNPVADCPDQSFQIMLRTNLTSAPNPIAD
jgi:hypothetical protein